MKDHLSKWDQEEYVLGQHTPAMIEHLQECPQCRADLARIEGGIALFRDAAIQWSAQSYAERPFVHLESSAKARTNYGRWVWPVAQVVMASMLLLILFIVHPWSGRTPQQSAAVQHAWAISDDALLQQVDDQLYAAVPTSMESLTHLVTTDSSQNSSKPAGARSQQHVQSN